jgi:hypothetical protein
VTLQRREKLGVKEGGFGKAEFGGDVAGEAEIWVLIDGAGDQAHNLLVLLVISAEYVGKRRGEGRSGLHGRKHDLADVVRHATHHALLVGLSVTWVVLLAGGDETERCACGSGAGAFLNLQDVWVHGSDVIQVAENEGLVHVKSYGNDVLRVFKGKPVALLQLQLRFKQELLVISKLNNQRHIEYVLSKSA